MKRIGIAAALAVLALGASSAVAEADQTLVFNIVGAGRVHIAGNVRDCTRTTPAAPLEGDCSAVVSDVLTCDDRGCPVHDPGSVSFQAFDADGYRFASWSHPQCGPIGGAPPFTENPCGVIVALFGPNPDLPVNATFTDIQAPQATLTAPANGAQVRGTIPLSATATDNSGSVSTLVFRVAGNPFQTFETPPFATNFDTRTRPDGPLTISATATDGAGLTNAATATVTVDNTSPTLTVTGPDGQTFGPGATPAWTLAAADANGTTQTCSVVPTGAPPVFQPCTSSTTERVDHPADGRYTLTVRATDPAGNFVERTKAFAVDTGPPDTTIASGPGDGSSTTGSTLTWGFTASEPGSTFECRVYLTALGANAFGPCSSPATHTVGGLGAGNYTFEVRATDSFGNTDPTPARRTVTVLAPPAPPPPVTAPPVVQPVVQKVVVVTLTFTFDSNAHTTRLGRLLVNSVPAGSTVTAVCPKGCAKKKLVVRNASGNVSVLGLAGKRRLKVSTRITVMVSKPGAVSAVRVLTIQRKRAPTVKSFCQPPGAKKPVTCA